nr:hypothetical protein [Halalkalirubrum salinum]
MFDYQYDHSHQQEMSEGTVTTTARVIDGAVLVAAKPHSGRETDLRDVLAVAEEIDTYDASYYEMQQVRAVESILSSLDWNQNDIRRELNGTPVVGITDWI